MVRNDGNNFQIMVYNKMKSMVDKQQFIIGNPYAYVHYKKKYYSRDRDDFIEADVSVEKYLRDPFSDEIPPSLTVIIECKDYKGYISVNELEEFHSKMQQIGADNTKGIMITRRGAFQKSAMNFAYAKGIGLARFLPDEQIEYILYDQPFHFSSFFCKVSSNEAFRALTEDNFISKNSRDFFCNTHAVSFETFMSPLIE